MRLRWGRIISIFLVFILLIGVGIYFIFFNKKEEKQIEETDKQEPVIEKKLQILDLESDSRPIAVMINNHKIAQPYQTGLNDAYLVCEIVVEGGITRMMAVFKNKDTATIGTVRSSRHYFLDYALENDAIYVHHGQSPQALADFSTLGIDRIEVAPGSTGCPCPRRSRRPRRVARRRPPAGLPARCSPAAGR